MNFPSTMMLPDASCVSLIRTHINNQQPIQSRTGTHSPSDSSPRSSSQPLSDISLTRRKTTSFLGHRYKPSVSMKQSACSSVIPDLPTSPFGITNFPKPLTPSQKSPSTTSQPNLQPLRNIFPTSSQPYIAALYAHLVAHNFLSSLISSTNQRFLSTNSHYPPTSSDPFDSAGMPFFTTSSYTLPSKAAAVLGAPPMAARPQIANPTCDAFILRTSEGGIGRVEELRDSVRGCVAWLICGMGASGSDGDGHGYGERWQEMRVDDILLRALGEIVGKSEMNCT